MTNDFLIVQMGDESVGMDVGATFRVSQVLASGLSKIPDDPPVCYEWVETGTIFVNIETGYGYRAVTRLERVKLSAAVRASEAYTQLVDRLPDNKAAIFPKPLIPDEEGEQMGLQFA